MSSFPEVPDTFKEISYTTADILCRINGISVVYQGNVFDYYLDGHGELEAIHLKYPYRRLFDGSPDDEHENYEMDSRFLIIPFSEMINININYRHLERIPESELSNEEKQQAIDLTPEIPWNLVIIKKKDKYLSHAGQRFIHFIQFN